MPLPEWEEMHVTLEQEPTIFNKYTRSVTTHLNRKSHTLDEPAGALGLTENAVCGHLATLERDGIVQLSGMHRSTDEPSSVYNLALAAEHMFPKAYDQVLQQLLDIVEERLTAGEMETLLREVGRRITHTDTINRHGTEPVRPHCS